MSSLRPAATLGRCPRPAPAIAPRAAAMRRPGCSACIIPRKYHMSPMPHSIFFRGGYAIHGTYATGSLGRPASHGCVRLSPGSRRATLSHGADRGRQHFHHGRASRLHPLRQRPSPRQDNVGESAAPRSSGSLGLRAPASSSFPDRREGLAGASLSYPLPIRSITEASDGRGAFQSSRDGVFGKRRASRREVLRAPIKFDFAAATLGIAFSAVLTVPRCAVSRP